MNIFDKLLSTLQEQNINFYGDLLIPNHFRIGVTTIDDLFSIIKYLRNFNFSFQTINSADLKKYIEYFFSNSLGGRNYLFSIVYNFTDSKNQVLKSIRGLFPESSLTEEYIEQKTFIRFEGGRKRNVLGIR